MFELAEEALDEVALAIEIRIDGSLPLAVALCRDVSLASAPADEIEQVLPVIAAVGDDDGRGRQPFEQSGGRGLVGGLSRGERKADR